MNSQCSQSQSSLHLHIETDSENTTQTDLNDTWDYVDHSLMDTDSTPSTSKRSRSDSENSDHYERKSLSKKHNVSGTRIESNQNENVIVFVNSENVNLGKTNPIFIAKTINDLVGSVQKVVSTQNGIKIFCNKSQANLLSKENKFGKYHCKFTMKNVPKPKVKGITHGIPLEIDLMEIKQELENANSIKIEEIYRLQKFDKIKQEKLDTESIIIEYSQDIEFPLRMFFGYRRITVKQFIPFPVRCFKCQKYGHVSKSCRGTPKCPICSENHSYEECDKQHVKCSNCGLNHSAGYKGCEEFLKAKKIKEFSHNNKISYAEAIKQIKTNTDVPTVELQSTFNISEQIKKSVQHQNKISEKVQNKVNEEALIEKVVDQIQTQTRQTEEQVIDQILEKVQSETTKYEDKITENITEKIISRTENRCRCKMPPEGIFVFIIRAIKCFRDENFIKKSSDSQIRLLARIFQTCTLINLNQNKVYDIYRS